MNIQRTVERTTAEDGLIEMLQNTQQTRQDDCNWYCKLTRISNTNWLVAAEPRSTRILSVQQKKKRRILKPVTCLHLSNDRTITDPANLIAIYYTASPPPPSSSAPPTPIRSDGVKCRSTQVRQWVGAHALKIYNNKQTKNMKWYESKCTKMKVIFKTYDVRNISRNWRKAELFGVLKIWIPLK